MASPYAELKAIEAVWAAEVEQAIRERSAWALIGEVEVDKPSARQTLGGYIDRRVVPVPKGSDSREVLEAWRHSPDGKLTDRIVQKANTQLLQRLPPPSARAMLDHPWPRLVPEGPIVLLGSATDLITVMRLSRSFPEADRLYPCAADAPAGVVTAIGVTPGVHATCILSVAVAMGLEGVMIVCALEVRSRATAKIARVDVSW